MTTNVKQNSPSIPPEIDYSQYYELAAMSDYFTTTGQGASLSDIKLTDLYRYLQNPYSNIKQIRQSSRYLTNKNGILKEVTRTFKSIPTLDYMISWSEYSDEKKIQKYERKINDFLEEIDVVDFTRSGLDETAVLGTVVTCLRNNKYVQFLDLDCLKIDRMRNGKWVVEYDLQTISTSSAYDIKSIIDSLPDEVTLEKYNLFKNKGDSAHRYVELKNCHVVGLDAPRNTPIGLPLALGAWGSILQKEMINRVERSVADRLIKQIFILKAGYIDKESTKLVPGPVIQQYSTEISKVLTKKENKYGKAQEDTAGSGLISLLQGLDLKALDVNTDMFKKELYEKIDNDIFQSIGVSAGLIYGGGASGNYSVAEMNSQKFFSYIFDILTKFERIINEYIKRLLPKDLSCKFKFFRTTLFDKQKKVDQYKDLYLQTGITKYYFEAATGLPYQEVIRQAKYEKEVLGVESSIFPPQNAYTRSDNTELPTGRPEDTSPTNENTVRSKSSGSNNNPMPSDNK